jgi:2-polyprenyl-3-methyl-5-hydroxy-6-metoxy-1,4-benzoquinol methylase
MSESLYDDGFTQITNIDFSPIAVKIMTQKYLESDYKIEYHEMNVFDMKNLKSSEYNAIIDKGTLDSILCGENVLPNIGNLMKEIFRLLAPDGLYFCISYGDEDHRRSFFVTSY